MNAVAEQVSVPALAPGTCLGKYQVVRLLGEGGMGAVYEGIHIAIGKKVAIKVMNPGLAADPDARARFLREAQLTSRVRHPHAVDVTDVGSEGDWTFLVMELLDGEDLASFIDWRGRLPLEQAADFMLAIAAAASATAAATSQPVQKRRRDGSARITPDASPSSNVLAQVSAAFGDANASRSFPIARTEG